MSIVQENACYVNIQLDRLQQQIPPSDKLLHTDDIHGFHLRRLQNVISSISVTSKTQPLLPATRLADLLSDPAFSSTLSIASEAVRTEEHVPDHLWLIAGKAAVQTSGLVMQALLEQTIQIHEEIHYWNEVLGSLWQSGFYAAQTSPVRLWHWSRDIYTAPGMRDFSASSLSRSVAARWAHFYQLARQSVSAYPAWSNFSDPIRSCRAEARQKRDRLLAIKDIHTSSLGLIMEDWHSFPTDSATVAEAESNLPKGQWQGSVSRTVALTEAILHHAVSPSTAPDFEQNVFAAIENSTIRLQAQDHDSSTTENPLQLIQRLIHVLRTQLPSHTTSVSTKIKRNGRPRAIIRYWLPLSIVLFSGSASLNFILHRKDDILQWIMDFGSTVIDFAQNWVVAPVHKLIGTIRHDEKSEIAIMSKNSLVADRDSLERMVLDFVRDRPESSQAMTPEDATLITNAVKEGDLTPVLRAYERDLRSPFKGTVRGDLVRALLIQIQKTKVDVEVAISGINALLKSQELVFGFVGLTPGILVTYSSLRWLLGVFGNRKGLAKGKRQVELKRSLRNSTRILLDASVSNGVISFKDSGRLICEAESLLQKVKPMLGAMQYREFREDIQDLLDVRSGVEKQLRVVERMRWTYCI
ncbi:hypothetical protein N7533_001872 [Penicillium manginii]|uniref:uncharacterized protein n=1 Tax=Penicillium manginii TaxID=203109 RepID=UPI0025494841|nr:uncharacterized protein N7533_001872 [Penicillium manginii]KAJ5763191.1 hypothetical protein N7533_001872 [Penicillium manginii]